SVIEGTPAYPRAARRQLAPRPPHRHRRHRRDALRAAGVPPAHGAPPRGRPGSAGRRRARGARPGRHHRAGDGVRGAARARARARRAAPVLQRRGLQWRRGGRLGAAARRARPLTLEQYLAEPYLAEPFRASDCCLVNDGAGAFVMTSVERARDLRQPPVTVLGVGAGVSEEGEYASLRSDYLATAAVHSAPRAFAL